MKKVTLMLASVFAITAQSMAHGNGYGTINSYADAFVFDEMGVTFSVYPDGEFDFYLAPTEYSNTVSNGYVNVTFNSGYDYNPYLQYDDFGAVIQVENVPIWYDYYGRVNQIGDVMITYRDRRVCQVGGLYVHYNGYGHYAYHTGFINTWNPYFVYRPFYVAFARPTICFVNVSPYRQYYTPVRYAYYRPYVHNVRPCFATVGRTYRPSGYGVAHQRYAHTPAHGEKPVVRGRQTITTAHAAPRPSSVNSNVRPNTKPMEVRPTTVERPVQLSQNSTRPSGTQLATSRPTNVQQPVVYSRPQTAAADQVQRPVSRPQTQSVARPTDNVRPTSTVQSRPSTSGQMSRPVATAKPSPQVASRNTNMQTEGRSSSKPQTVGPARNTVPSQRSNGGSVGTAPKGAANSSAKGTGAKASSRSER